MSKRSKKNKSIQPFSFDNDNDNLDYQSIAKSWDIDMLTNSDDSISLPDDQSTNSSRSKENKKTKNKKKQIQNNDDIYVDNLANLGKVITVKELFIDTMDLEQISKLPCHILADYGKKYIDLKQEKDIIINQLNFLGISNPEKILSRVQKVPIYCKEPKILQNKDQDSHNLKNNNNTDNNADNDDQEEFIYGFIFQIICAIVLICILGYVIYKRLYINK